MIRTLCEKTSRFYERHGRKRVIGGDSYMWRHYLLFKGQEFERGNTEKREYSFNAFLHNIRGSDEPTYHDHPWPYVTLILAGGYWEHTPIFDRFGYVIGDKKKWYGPGSIIIGRPSKFHWLEMGTESTWTLFLRFKRCQEWGFLPVGKDSVSHWEDKVHWKKWTEERQAQGHMR